MDKADAGPSTEILQYVTASLAAAPERADLWMMRFEVQKALGLKREFADALMLGWRHPRVSQLLDWHALRTMWRDLAPDEPLPDGIEVPDAPAAAGAVAPAAPAHNRRFSDTANRIAGRELAALAKAYAALQARPGFHEDFARKVAPLLKRPTPLQPAETFARGLPGGARIFFKREDLRPVTPEQENATAQCHVAVLLGRLAVISANDVDGHALALADAAPRFGLKCILVVRGSDLQRKPALIAQLRGRGAQLEVMADFGPAGADPREGAVRLWQKSMGFAHLILSLGTGPNPYPAMANNFQSLLGRETELQYRAVAQEGRPRTMVAAVQSEADSIGFMLPHLGRAEVELMYAEPDPGGTASWRSSARLRAYNGAVREHAWLRGLNRIEHVAIPDAQARACRDEVGRTEKVQLSLEDARAVALTAQIAARQPAPRDYIVLVA
jgi:tryptophan synthase beta chain